ncbi:hypothetical protein [Streptomyces sp. NBC_00102]|uniref:hypothetical protein n=1 Tax=Streptomyces sp. NBC_00102 TaxID=2975652 RepID=UPI002253CB46|nr:hypothetical protein [Streptomyces sp. NBC_00102]MCX5399827.1 hypothetical protein [Streptomyces sp. NBC_00102]
MGNLYDYYAATGDTQAIALSEDEDVAGPADPFGLIGLKGVMPHGILGIVESCLTGRSEEQVEADPRFCELVSEDNEDGPWLVSLTDTLRDALAEATPDRLLEAATAWTRTEDGADQDPELMADFLERLAGLARDAGPQRGLYCRMSL